MPDSDLAVNPVLIRLNACYVLFFFKITSVNAQ